MQSKVVNRRVRERKSVQSGRLVTELLYADGATDHIEWQLFRPDELAALAARHRLVEVLSCSAFDETVAPTPASPRMQFVFAPG